MSTREVLTISVGQGGCQLGNVVWTQYCKEHFIRNDGSRDYRKAENAGQLDDNCFLTFFEDTGDDHFVPRNLCVDLEPSVLDTIRMGPMQALFYPEMLVNGYEDAANNFARGHYSVGMEQMEEVGDCIRKLVDQSDSVQGFVLQHSIGGGTGSGLGMLIMERLAVDYRKKARVGFEIYPSPNISTCIVEPYNGLFSTHWLLDHSDVSLVLDNEALYGICENKLNMKEPDYSNLNQIIAKVISSMTTAIRYFGELEASMDDFQTNLVPFPRLHFMTTSLAPVVSKLAVDREALDTRKITDECMQARSFLVKYLDFDEREDKYLAISLTYRGDVKSQEANGTVQWIKSQKKVNFVEWCPTGFKIAMNPYIAEPLRKEDMARSERNAVMIGNNIAISRVFSSRLTKKFDAMFSQRAYVHWYVGEGMELNEFLEAREDLEFLDRDYIDVVTDQASDDEIEEPSTQ